MPLVAKGTNGTLQAYIRDGAGVPAVCSDLELTVYDPTAVIVLGFPVVSPAIVADGVGLYHYVWSVSLSAVEGTYTAVWEGTVAGTVATGSEDWEVVAGGSIHPGAATFLVAGDYESIRHLLGVTDLDLTDDVIESMAFVQHAEIKIKSAVPDWATYAVGGTEWEYLQLADIYGTAALIAESFAKGGMVSLARGPAVQGRTIAEWDAIAKTLWGYFPQLLGAAKEEPPAVMSSVYNFSLVRMSGPTSAAIRDDPTIAEDLMAAWLEGNPKYFGGEFDR